MQLINWSDKEYALCLDIMDNTHREFVAIINQINTAPDTDFSILFEHLMSHTEAHFARENELMEKTGFPAIAEHKAEHMRILGEFHQFNSRVNKGLYTFVRAYIRDSIPQWFKLHLATMDSALAAHLRKYLSHSPCIMPPLLQRK